MNDKRTVLITGAAGLIGGVLSSAFEGRYVLRSLDRRPAQGSDSVVADTTDPEAITPAFRGVDTVVDLAAASEMYTPWGPVYANNIPSTYNVLEASKQAGVRRVVFASSNHVTGLYENDPPYSDVVAGRYDGLDPETLSRITVDMPIRPDGPYGIAKAFGEASGRYFSECFGLSVICLRIGSVVRENRPLNIRHFATLLTHRDLAELVHRCIEAPESVRFGVFYGVSKNRWRIHDIENACKEIGYSPQDDTETWR